jgi:hypothetical protein
LCHFFEAAGAVAYARSVTRSGFSLMTLVLLFAAGPARAENLLEGPYPFRHDNELSFHGGFGAGFGDTFAGPKAVIDYGYKLNRGFWLDLDLGLLSGVCRPRVDSPACVRKGDTAEVLIGVKWKLRMSIPVVPYAKLVAGLAYQFPDSARSAAGPMARAGVGAKYFFYEWIGVGGEVTASVGRAGYQDGATLSRGLSGLDATLGAELQF